MSYDNQARKWRRDAPLTFSDLVARSVVLDYLRRIASGRTVLDLGCGEGFVARKVAQFAGKVFGVDLSREMIRCAVEREAELSQGIIYHVGSATHIPFIESESIDVCTSNFVANYLSPEELFAFYAEVSRTLKRGGRFAISIPHPAFSAAINKVDMTPTNNDLKFDYKQSRGQWIPGVIETIDGDLLEVGVVHSTIEDHFIAIERAELLVSNVLEPVADDTVVENYPRFADLQNRICFLVILGVKNPCEFEGQLPN